jgi:hypothetical protein
MKYMRAFSALALMLLFRSVTAGAAPADYPLRIFVVQTTWNHKQVVRNGTIENQGATGEGHGNIQEGNLVTGFDYTFSCSDQFNASTGDPSNPLTGYQGRWKKQGTRLAILVVEIGNPKHRSECELKTSLVDVIYSISPERQLVSYTRQQYDEAMAWRKASAAMTHPADTDPAHFPLKVWLLEALWQNHRGGGVMGEGRGNVHNGDSVMAFSFTAPRCVGTLSAESGRNAYLGKWLEEPARLLLLLHTIGGTETSLQCELQTKVQPNNVFVKNAANGVIQTLTQDQNRARLQAARTTQRPPAPAGAGADAGPAASASQKLSVTSNPDGADIEVDGAFVGSTPSVIELSQGYHSVVIRKHGYKPWERKLKLGSGDVKLNADLEIQ